MRQRDVPPDLQSQLEELFHEVWTAEARERLTDRIDNAIRLDDERKKRERRAAERDDPGTAGAP